MKIKTLRKEDEKYILQAAQLLVESFRGKYYIKRQQTLSTLPKMNVNPILETVAETISFWR